MTRISFTEKAWEDYLSFSNEKEILKRINELIKDIKRSPYQGIGKLERLKHFPYKRWSRRINEKDRLVYFVDNDEIIIIQCKGHYNDN